MAKGSAHSGQRQAKYRESELTSQEKSLKKSKRDDEASLEDTSAEYSGDKTIAASDSDATTWQEQLIESIDFLTEKRSANRVYALKHIKEIMRKHMCKEELINYVTTVAENVYHSLDRSGSVEESVLALQVLALLALTLGGSEHSSQYISIEGTLTSLDQGTLQRIENKLRSIITNVDEDGDIRRSAVFTFSVWTFVTKHPEDYLQENGAISLLESLWPKVPDLDFKADQKVLAEALSCWSFLSAQLGANLVEKYVFPNQKNRLMKLILNTHSRTEVRRNATEALCLMKEVTDFEDNSDLFDRVVDEVENLSTHTDRSTHKKEKASRKGVFRDYLNYLESMEAPTLPVTIKEVTFNLNSWRVIVEYNILKAVLKEGINTHIEENDLVRNMLGVEHISFNTDEPRKLTSLEKRAYLSKSSSFSKDDTKLKNKLTRAWSGIFEPDLE